jgi:hypothetical protein
MISPVACAALTGAIVAGANVVEKKTVSGKQLIGTGVYLVGLAGINETSPDIAGKFALIVLIGVLFTKGPALVKGMGLA